MTEDDLDSFKRIYISAFSVSKEHQKEYDFAKYLMPFIHDSDKHALMFYSGETAVGVILALEKPSFSDELSVYIEVCAVDAMYQRQGHGTAMINMFLEKLGKNAFVTLTTFKSRPSYEWYMKNGFIDDDKVRYLIHNNAVCLIFKEIQNLKEQLNGISENLENYPAEAIEKSCTKQ